MFGFSYRSHILGTGWFYSKYKSMLLYISPIPPDQLK